MADEPIVRDANVGEAGPRVIEGEASVRGNVGRVSDARRGVVFDSVTGTGVGTGVGTSVGIVLGGLPGGAVGGVVGGVLGYFLGREGQIGGIDRKED